MNKDKENIRVIPVEQLMEGIKKLMDEPVVDVPRELFCDDNEYEEYKKAFMEGYNAGLMFLMGMLSPSMTMDYKGNTTS